MQVWIGLECDGWEVNIDGRVYRWNHNDETLGTSALREIFEDLGYEVEVEEVY